MKLTWPLILWVVIMAAIAGLWASCASASELTPMHVTEITATTYAMTDVGYRLFPGAPKWMVPAIGMVGCGLYRIGESGREDIRWKKYGLDCLGMCLRAGIEIKF